MAKPTAEQIKAEVKKLREMKTTVRHRTAFGEDNWEAIEVQAEVLEKGLDIDAIFNRWGEGAAEEDQSERLDDQAMQALHWREGDENISPSEGWASLVGK